MFEMSVILTLELMGTDHILPPEFFPLITLAPEKSFVYFLKYFRDVKKAYPDGKAAKNAASGNGQSIDGSTLLMNLSRAFQK